MPSIKATEMDAHASRPTDFGLQSAIESAHLAFQEAVAKGYKNWIVMFSGGKDSTALAVLAIEWIKLNIESQVELNIVFSDTGVEIPTINKQAANFLDYIENLHIDQIKVHRFRPKLEQTFWTLMIGKGYPPPNQNFRWCTDKLKIRPAQDLIKVLQSSGSTAVFTGVRFGESDVRDSRMYSACSRGGECGQGVWFDDSKRKGAAYFAPIAFWRQCDVWDFVNFEAFSLGYPTSELETVYNGKDTRFGCWTCSVVTRDVAMLRTIENGHTSFKAMLDFRSWMIEQSAILENRVIRPNNAKGRLNLATRRNMLYKLLETQQNANIELISQEEVEEIRQIWRNPKYGDQY
ncbi:phosphoadenosine phosphosulfate reductase family protein [Deinococcus caeni]|uniref:Phosphoadenosine phosphosulphate reductase domain-containing protein n=1 Tax=Deinococcus caeni TaxID=569127 RepID=A0ABP9UHG2_9DEIO